MVRDRRSGADRREVFRYAAQIEISWENLAGTERGMISDISRKGCFVLCSGEVVDGENIKLSFPRENGKIFILWGEVVYHVYEIGFAVRFIELGSAEQRFLECLLFELGAVNTFFPSRRR
jgi:hypothetical protein